MEKGDSETTNDEVEIEDSDEDFDKYLIFGKNLYLWVIGISICVGLLGGLLSQYPNIIEDTIEAISTLYFKLPIFIQGFIGYGFFSFIGVGTFAFILFMIIGSEE